MFGRFSGIRAQSGQTKINDELTAWRLSPNWEECGPCLVFASYTQEFGLQLRKKYEQNLSECKLNENFPPIQYQNKQQPINSH